MIVFIGSVFFYMYNMMMITAPQMPLSAIFVNLLIFIASTFLPWSATDNVESTIPMVCLEI